MENKKFNSIDVESLNIVDKDGTIRLKLFNNDNIPPAMMDGRDILPGHRQDLPAAGLMFYNSEGDECGGLIYGSEKDEDGNYQANASLTFDQFKQDQVVQMQFAERNGESTYGFSIYDRPYKPLPDQVQSMQEIENSNLSEKEKKEALNKVWEGHERRAFMGKTADGEITVQLMDSKGKSRIRILVDDNDEPKLEFLDADGNVTYKLPPE